MNPALGFAVALGVTLVLLGFTVATGLRARRRWHIPLAVLSVASLVVTIVFAKELGKHYDFESAGLVSPIHHVMARVTAGAYLLPITTGLWTIFRPVARRWHRRVAFLVLALTVLTAITGTMMILLAERIG
jgi:hypothetical protein